MKKLIKANSKFERKMWTREEAREYFSSINQDYKVEILDSLEGDNFSIYTQGNLQIYVEVLMFHQVHILKHLNY